MGATFSFVTAYSNLFSWRKGDISLHRCRLFPVYSQVFFGSNDSQSQHSIDSIRMEVFRQVEFAWLKFSILFPSYLLQYRVAEWGKTYSSSDEFIGHDSKGKEINRIRMIHLADNLRSHVSRSSTGVLSITWLNFPGNS